MTAHAARRAGSFDLVDWVQTQILHACALAVAALALGGVLYYAWNPIAGVFSFLNPIHGYWNCTLVVLGAYAVVMIWNAARSTTTADVLSGESRAAALDYVGKALVLLALAWLASSVLQ
jgi:hypothetical protein